jgi:hypothetical protein
VGRGRGGPGRRRTSAEDRQEIEAWFAGRLGPGVLGEDVGIESIAVDDDEILVLLRFESPPESAGTGAAAEAGTIGGIRERTRDQRVQVAAEAQDRFGRVVSWGAVCGSTRQLFTTASVPVMTRLRLGERRVLDTLVDAGVARSRSEALAWCVRLVAEHEGPWIEELRAAFDQVDAVRRRGPAPPAEAAPEP